MPVAVVIVNYNSGSLLRRCLEHLSRQTLKPDQIVIVDNNSQDEETNALLNELSNAQVIRSSVNVGFGAAVNLGVNTLSGVDYVCSLNPDAFVTESWLEHLVAAAAAHPEYGSFASLTLMDEMRDMVDGAGDELHVSGLHWRRFHGFRLADMQLQPTPQFSACAAAALYRIDAFLQVGGFDESFFMYGEDVDIGFRLQLAGYPCLFVPDAIAYHIGSATSGRDSDLSLYYGHRNLVWNYFKNMPLFLLLLTLPFHLALNVLSIFLFALRGRGKIISRSKIDAFKGLSNILARRNEIRQTVGSRYIWTILAKRLRRKIW